jgi:hypothetical protein
MYSKWLGQLHRGGISCNLRGAIAVSLGVDERDDYQLEAA